MGKQHDGVLLTMGEYRGTIAATRFYGRHGVAVHLAEWRYFVPARWSRYVRENVTCPSVSDFDRFGDWLVAFGEYRLGERLRLPFWPHPTRRHCMRIIMRTSGSWPS